MFPPSIASLPVDFITRVLRGETPGLDVASLQYHGCRVLIGRAFTDHMPDLKTYLAALTGYDRLISAALESEEAQDMMKRLAEQIENGKIGTDFHADFLVDSRYGPYYLMLCLVKKDEKILPCFVILHLNEEATKTALNLISYTGYAILDVSPLTP